MSKLQQEALDLVVELDVKKCKEGSSTLSDKVMLLADFLGNLRTLISKASNTKKEAVEEELIEEMEYTIQIGLTHKTGIVEAIKAGKASTA